PTSATTNITAAGYYYFDGGAWQKMTGESAIDATTTSKGIVQLAGDLTGSASSPNITSNAVTNSKIADNAVTTSKLLDNSVTVAKLPSGATGTTFLRGDGTWATPDATNIYNSDGTLIGTRTVNTAGNSLRISGGGQLVVQTADNSGKIRLSPADTSHTGYMEVIKGDNTRLGYIGWDNTNILYNVENGASHIFGGGNVGIGTTAPSTKLEVNSGTANTSGVKLTNLPSASLLATDSNGNIISGSNNTSGVSTTKQRLVPASPSIVVNSASGDFSFRYGSTAVSGYGQIRFNKTGTRSISTFIIENWVSSPSAYNGYYVSASSGTLSSNTWTNIPGGTVIGQTGELNTYRIYDLNTGITYILEINLVDNSGVYESMILQEY
ncbi:hypothetical protein, partial [Chryseobacterium taeanense]|uniref:hypothetical protein n=1 Tax=Chryseobacterium taeanense TaxID=311334 RepID=UPI0035AFEA93